MKKISGIVIFLLFELMLFSGKAVDLSAQVRHSSEASSSSPSSLLSGAGELGRPNSEKVGNQSAREALPELSLQAAPAPASTHKPHGTELLGLEPGVTTLKQVEASPIWSKPGHRENTNGYLILTYRIDDLPDMPFIQVMLKNETVEGIVMHLKDPRELKDTKLSFDDVIRGLVPITVADGKGGFREIYPEKGLAFVLEKGEDSSKPSTRVTQIVAEPVRAVYLLIRAERTIETSPREAWRDAQHAVQHEPENAMAHWLLARLEFSWGKYEEAKQHALRAVRVNSNEPQYCLTLVKILKELKDFEGAFQLLKRTVTLCDKEPLGKVEAEFLLGDLYRDSASPNFEQAVACHRRVLEAAELFLKDKDPEVRILMKDIARKANIALAADYAQLGKSVEEKNKAFQYLNAASALADDLIKNENADIAKIWEVCLAATETGLNNPNFKELEPYIVTLKKIAQNLIKGKEKSILDTETVRLRTGKALFGTLLICDLQKNYSAAIQNGLKAFEFLDHPELKEMSEKDRILLGDLTWNLGRIYQENLNNDAEALKMYEKSAAFYKTILEYVKGQEAARIGLNMLRTSNGLWNIEQNEFAPSITVFAVLFLEKAVNDGLLARSELVIPYTNLAMMYQKLGKKDLAKKYALQANEIKSKITEKKDN